MPEYDFIIKVSVVVAGDAGVGKSNLIARYVRNFFNSDPAPTVGVDFATKQLKVDDKKIKVQLWDTAGQERFRGVIGAYFRGAHGVLMVYDITNAQTFQNLGHWMDQIKLRGNDPIAIVLAGNKEDLNEGRSVPYDEARLFAEKRELTVMECSAKNSHNVDSVFQTLVQEIVNKLDGLEQDCKNNNITIAEKSNCEAESKSCHKTLWPSCC